MTYLWSNYGQILVKIGHFSKLTITWVFFRTRGVNESSLKPSSWAEFVNTKKKSIWPFFGKNDLFLTLIWPYFDPKWSITIVWTELFGPMRAPRNRPHELHSIEQNKKNIFFIFFKFYGQITIFLTQIWPLFDHK